MSDKNNINLDIEVDFVATLVRDGNNIDFALSHGVTEDDFIGAKNKFVAGVVLKDLYEIECDSFTPAILRQHIQKRAGVKDVFKSESEIDTYVKKIFSIDLTQKDTIPLLVHSLKKAKQENILKLQCRNILSGGAVNDEALAGMQNTVESMRLSKREDKFITLAEANANILGKAEVDIATIEAGGTVEGGLMTAYPKFDDVIGGFKPGQVMYVGGTTGGGKTTLTSNFAWRISRAYPTKNIAIFSFEMTIEEMHAKLFCIDKEIDSKTLDVNKITRSVIKKMKDFMDEGKGHNIHLYHTGNINIHELAALCKRKSMELTAQGLEPLSFIIVDHIGLIAPTKGSLNKEATISEITRRLKTLAGELNCSIVAPTQLNRDFVKRKSKDGKDEGFLLSDLRDSACIANDANFVIFINNFGGSDHVTVQIEKNRSGQQKVFIPFHFNRVTGVFTETNGTVRPMPEKEAKKIIEKGMKHFHGSYSREPEEYDFDIDRPF